MTRRPCDVGRVDLLQCWVDSKPTSGPPPWQAVRPMSVLVLDVGSSTLRAAVVRPDGTLAAEVRRQIPRRTPGPGLVELDATSLAEGSLAVAGAALERVGRVEAVAVTTQRASTMLWERATGKPVGPVIGWQDLRTVGRCLALRPSGLRLSPNQSATKLAHLLEEHRSLDPEGLCFGTIDSWLAWVLTEGGVHVTDATNAGVTGLVLLDGSAWDQSVLSMLSIPPSVLPRIVDSSGVLGPATALRGAPPLAALVGDQQAALVGQGCIFPGEAKATFGTGAMLDCSTGLERPGFAVRGEAGTVPVVAWRVGGEVHWGIEAIMLAAGTCVDWLRDGLGLVSSAEETDALASSVRDSGGVSFVPALSGLGTPVWDFGARGTILGLSASTTRAELVRAVLEGIAQRGADLVEAAEADAGRPIERLRVDGGMCANATFVQLLADATRRPVELARLPEMTVLGAAYLAGLAIGTWSSLEEAVSTTRPRAVLEPVRRLDRGRWLEARARAEATVPAMTAIRF